MPQKDYVRASRPKPKPKAKAQPRRSNGRQTKAARPWLLIGLTLCLLIGFGIGLYLLGQQPAEQVPLVSEPAKPVKKDELPARPTQEPYQYITELENKEVVVDVEEQQRLGPFQMQCGSFRQQQQAEAMKAQIAFAGIASTVRRTEGTNGVWFRVVLGPYESRRAATVDRNRLQQQNINGCQIWNWT
ncbi:SPOR domain-containing protein [Arsukibacterium sp.]|uniref:SPOR domain-containing protein n=1 Tax=Arsukibacterium sp. TaxID=1977258 RepID=UPI002FD9BFF8